jgi:transcription factor E
MQIKILKDIISGVVGAGAGKIVDLLYEKKNVNEFLIAKSLGLTINQTRNVLYKMADEGLVNFIRKKDKKKGGWYIYFWTLNSGRSLIKFRDKLVIDIENLKQQLEGRRKGRIFYCTNCNIEYTEENSLLNGYVCSECGEVLQLKDNAQAVLDLEKQISKFEALLSEVNVEIGEINVKEEKSKTKRLKAEAKKKESERLERRKEKQRLLKKLQKEEDNKKAQRKAKKADKKKGKAVVKKADKKKSGWLSGLVKRRN